MLSASAHPALADVKLPDLFGDHMVLQRDQLLPIWGWADPGEQVTVKLDHATATAIADNQGNWKVMLPALHADGDPHRMIVSGRNTVVVEDILIGDVWLGSGQSNMEFTMGCCSNAREATTNAIHPQIRLMTVPKVRVPQPARDIAVPGAVDGKKESVWQPSAQMSAANFSGVLYFFGLRLHKELGVPIGLIGSSFGGSGIEFWQVSNGTNADMYNGMIAPVKPFRIRGVLWYQGEANVENGLRYADQMKDLIEGWRKVWGYDFPFYFVQIAPCAAWYKPDSLPWLWEAQVATLKIPGTGMAVTTDLVETNKLGDIHPGNKIDVGNRLARWALAKEYKQDIVYSGPLYKAMKVEGARIRLSFAHVGGGLQSRDNNPLTEFEIAGADDKFVPATAAIDGPTLVVESPQVTAPTQVRFGWRNVANPNLVNKAGLPASPFHTSNWRGGTGE